MKNVKITVYKKHFYPELAKKYLTDGIEAGDCPILNEGDVFIYNGSAIMPENFCPWAWIAIYSSVSTFAKGGTCKPWYKNDSQSICCCSDGVRPVIFIVEAID